MQWADGSPDALLAHPVHRGTYVVRRFAVPCFLGGKSDELRSAIRCVALGRPAPGGGGMTLDEGIEAAGKGLDIAGILIIAVGALGASVLFVGRVRRGGLLDAYSPYRQSLGRAILLGLEFLVAGDIIRTVAISPTFLSVGLLGAIVLIRTFLSFALQVETEGRWPWQPHKAERPADKDPPGLSTREDQIGLTG